MSETKGHKRERRSRSRSKSPGAARKDKFDSAVTAAPTEGAQPKASIDSLAEDVDEEMPATAPQNEQNSVQQQTSSASPALPFSYSLPSTFQSQLGTTLYARRIYVGNVQPCMSESQLKEFLYEILKKASGCLEPGNPIIGSSKNIEKKFMFFEFRSVEETSAAIQLDGIRYQDVNLRIRRPPEYEKNPRIEPRRPVPILDTVALGIISTQVNDGSGKLFIGGLPKEYSEDQVKNLLQRYGRLRSFHLVKETGELNSRGFGFCEYVDDACAERALSMLNGMKIGSRIINLRRTQDHHPASLKNTTQLTQQERERFFERLPQFLAHCAQIIGKPQALERTQREQEELRTRNQETEARLRSEYNYQTCSPVVRVTIPALTLAMLEDQREYEAIQEEVLSELRKFGKVLSFTFPRLRDLRATSTIKQSGMGKMFVEFEEVSSAFACYNLLYEREFMGQPVVIEFFSRDQYITQSLF